MATLVPFGSEVYLSTLILLNKYNILLLLLSASLGNVLGSVFNWTCGYYAEDLIKKKWIPISRKNINKASIFFLKYGKWSLLLSWLPLIGDPITFVAGTLKYPILPFLFFVSIGKVGRYILVYFLITGSSNIF